jgi:hypothetical protein
VATCAGVSVPPGSRGALVRFSTLIGLVAIALGMLPLASAPRGARLEWDAPASCPDRAHVVGEIEAILGASATGDPTDVVARAEVRVHEGRHRLTIRVQTPSGTRTRELEADACDDLAAYTAVLVAIAIDPGATGSVGNEATQPQASTSRANDAEPSAGRSSGPDAASLTEAAPGPASTQSRLRPAGSVLAYVGPSIGTLSSTTAVVGLGGALRWRALRIDLGVGHRIVRATDRAPSTTASADLWSTFGHVDACAVPHVPRVEFPLCGGVEVGALSGRGRDVREPRAGRAAWLAFRLGVGLLASPWRRVALGVRGTVQVPVVRARFGIDGVGELHRVGPVGGDVTAVVEVRFP